MTNMNSKGRPKTVKPIETLKFTTYQEELTMFKNGLIDSLDDEENEDQFSKETVKKFLNMEVWRQNIFIVYLLNKHSKFTFKELANLLQVDRVELRRAIVAIKNELQEI